VDLFYLFGVEYIPQMLQESEQIIIT